MPSKTAKQARAMRAAAAGNSTLGIPKAVGKEFVSADKRTSRGHGVLKDQTAKGMAGQRKTWRGA